MFNLLHNHVGYECGRSKQAIVQSDRLIRQLSVELLNLEVAHCYTPQVFPPLRVELWQKGYFYLLDFSAFDEAGGYQLQVCADGVVKQVDICIAEQLLTDKTLADVVAYLHSQRCQGIWDEADRKVSCYADDSGQRFDVHGGWYDASGDKSKYLSHLSYASSMNPQQTPMVVWNLLEALNSTAQLTASVRDNLVREAVYGAEFLVRMQHPDGFFFTTVFDNWSADPTRRQICSYKTQAGHRNAEYKAGWRMGAGVSIAALARAAKLPTLAPEMAQLFLNTAIKGFAHLQVVGCSYLNDGRENIIDDYCALLAATELYAATGDGLYQQTLTVRLTSLLSRLAEDSHYQGWLRIDDTSLQPFAHAAEEGLPMLTVLRALAVGDVDAKLRSEAERFLKLQIDYYCQVSFAVNNPFAYPRQYRKPLQGEKVCAFFYPHDNGTGYWWQGENARLASLATAFRQVQRYFNSTYRAKQCDLLSQAALNWILGLNPYNICMLQGHGYHNPQDFTPEHHSVNGGICNGITAGMWDEDGIDFAPTTDPNHAWRWSEQWLPHAAWYLLAVCNP